MNFPIYKEQVLLTEGIILSFFYQEKKNEKETNP